MAQWSRVGFRHQRFWVRVPAALLFFFFSLLSRCYSPTVPWMWCFAWEKSSANHGGTHRLASSIVADRCCTQRILTAAMAARCPPRCNFLTVYLLPQHWAAQVSTTATPRAPVQSQHTASQRCRCRNTEAFMLDPQSEALRACEEKQRHCSCEPAGAAAAAKSRGRGSKEKNQAKKKKLV